ncbi:MAG: DUF349 domain-containing protein [Paludibacteraceae bacterium]
MDAQNPTPEKDDLTQGKIVPEEVQQEKATEELHNQVEEKTEKNTGNQSDEIKTDIDSEGSVKESPAVEENVAPVVEAESANVIEEEKKIESESKLDDKNLNDEDNADTDVSVKIIDLSKQELYDLLKEKLDGEDILRLKSEVESIKQTFYKISKNETDQQRVTFVEEGGDELDFIPNAPELETEFKELLSEYRNRKAKFTAQLEQEKENNLLKKNHIIEQMKQLTESKEDVSANIAVFRQLQQDWKKIGQVPAGAVNDLWKQYNQYQEAFWDLIKINNELREYDFKKNLEAKTKLIEQAEALDVETDVVSAFRQLQKLHEEWHELGPVARDLREEVWDRFKAASTVINKKHQSHFEDIREIEEKNLERKIALCEKIEAVDTSGLSSYKDWDGATKNILEMQEEWRQIGFAPRKSNQKVFERYRKACDTFFSAKAEFYKEIKANLNENLEKKKVLCEKVEALKDSTEWKETSEILIQLQKEWKTIGPTPKKFSDEVWKRFITACDYFFEQRNKNVSGKRTDEAENLDKKKELIEQIKTFQKTDNPGESLTALRGLAAEWNSIGHVPYKEKDKIYKEYRSALDAQFDILNVSVSQRRLESFKSNLKDMSRKGENKLYREREKLVRAYEHLKSEIATYENNIGFLSISSKKGGGMLHEMERKIETLKDECKLLEQKINMIDENTSE